MAPPLIDTSIVPEVPSALYALFDYGLTKQPTFSVHSLYLELALISTVIAVVPSLFYCYYFIWKDSAQ